MVARAWVDPAESGRAACLFSGQLTRASPQLASGWAYASATLRAGQGWHDQSRLWGLRLPGQQLPSLREEPQHVYTVRVTAKSLAESSALVARKKAWAEAYRSTPRGQP